MSTITTAELTEIADVFGSRVDRSTLKPLAALGNRLATLERRIDEQKSALVALHRQRREQHQAQAETEPLLIRARRALIRVAAIEFVCHVRGGRIAETIQHLWPEESAGGQRALLEECKGLLTTKAAAPPAFSSTPGWAKELAAAKLGIYAVIAPNSTYAALAARGERYALSGIGELRLPNMLTDAVSNFWLTEGQPIAVWRLALSTTSLWPHRGGGICCFSAELAEHAAVNIEQVLGAGMEAVAAKSIDSALVDNVAASAVRPAGLLAGLTPLTATAGGGTAALAGDLSQLAAAIQQPADLVFLMNEAERVRALALAPGLLGVSIILAPQLPAGTVIALDAASFASAEGSEPRLRLSDKATLHLEGATPLPIGTVGTPATVAAPTSSLWAEDLLAIRLISPVSWVMREAGKVATVAGVTW